MQVFHYLANVLKDVPLFDSKDTRPVDVEEGAVYNDFDHCPMELLRGDQNTFSYSQMPHREGDAAGPSTAADVSVQEATDHAVMEADRVEGVHYDHLTWETDLFDNYSDVCNWAYCTKVFKLVTNEDGCWDQLKITDLAKLMFERRLRTNWDMPDTVYDAWILRNGLERSWFDNHLFFDIMYSDSLTQGQAIQDDLDAISCYQQQQKSTKTSGVETGKDSITTSSYEDEKEDEEEESGTSGEGNESSGEGNETEIKRNKEIATDGGEGRKRKRRLISSESSGNDNNKEGENQESHRLDDRALDDIVKNLTPVLSSTPLIRDNK